MIIIITIICVVTFLGFLRFNHSVRVGHALHARDSWSQRQHSSPPHGWMYITTLLNAPPLPIQFPDYTTTNSTSTSESAPAAVLKHHDDDAGILLDLVSFPPHTLICCMLTACILCCSKTCQYRQKRGQGVYTYIHS